MSEQTPIRKQSLIERAAEIYDFRAHMRARQEKRDAIIEAEDAAKEALRNAPEESEPAQPASTPIPHPPAIDFEDMDAPGADARPRFADQAAPAPSPTSSPAAPVAPQAPTRPVRRDPPPGAVPVSRERLRKRCMIVPDGPVSGVSEEFRIVKRRLLLNARGAKGLAPLDNGRRILVCSAHPGDGKTYCATNLALSMAAEKDIEVLLVDADFANPNILKTLGMESAPGFMDVLSDPSLDAESYVIPTDIPGLSVLPAGMRTNNDTEFLASSRTEKVLDALTANNPSRFVIFDSPPALAASPASVLAMHVGQVLMVVKADTTTETALRDALGLLGGCEHIELLLNGVKFSPTGRRFGSYYGYGE